MNLLIDLDLTLHSFPVSRTDAMELYYTQAYYTPWALHSSLLYIYPRAPNSPPAAPPLTYWIASSTHCGTYTGTSASRPFSDKLARSLRWNHKACFDM